MPTVCRRPPGGYCSVLTGEVGVLHGRSLRSSVSRAGSDSWCSHLGLSLRPIAFHPTMLPGLAERSPVQSGCLTSGSGMNDLGKREGRLVCAPRKV